MVVNSNKSAIIAKDKEWAKELHNRLKRYKENPYGYIIVDSNFWEEKRQVLSHYSLDIDSCFSKELSSN